MRVTRAVTTPEQVAAELVLEPNQFADELFDGLVDATVVVTDGDVPNALGECRPENNHASAYVECIPPG